jgi:hypothetical protein
MWKYHVAAKVLHIPAQVRISDADICSSFFDSISVRELVVKEYPFSF